MSEPRIPTSPRVALEPREETTCSRCGTRCLDYRSPGPVCIGCVDEDRRAVEAQVARLQEGRDRRWTLAVEVDTLRAQVARLERERDEALRLAYMGEHRFPENSWRHRCEEVVPILREAQAESARLRGAVDDLAGCVRHYRDMYERHGARALETGRAWDLMRRAEHAARAALSPAPVEGEAKHSIDECPACGEWMGVFGGEVFDGTAETCEGCGATVEAHVRDGRAFTTANPTPEKARETP